MNIVYINEELLVTLTNFNQNRLKELERKIDVILESFNINKININIKDYKVDINIFNDLKNKYKTQKKKLNLCFDKNYL